MKYFLVTAFGKDRPGIVSGVTGAFLESGGNLEDATMTRLGGEFAMMWVVGLPANYKQSRLQKALATVKRRLGLQVAVRPIAPKIVQASRAGEPQCLISVYGTDKPGIVHRVATLLAKEKVNITDLNTRVMNRPQGALYVMLIEGILPRTLTLETLGKSLEKLSKQLEVEITVQDFATVTL